MGCVYDVGMCVGVYEVCIVCVCVCVCVSVFMHGCMGCVYEVCVWGVCMMWVCVLVCMRCV